MLNHARTFNQNVVKLFGPIDLEQVNWPKKNRSDGKVRIVFATSRVLEDNLASIFLPTIGRILKKYDKQIEVHFLGMHPKGMAASPNVYVKRYTGNYDRFLQNFSKAGYDIGLAPLQDDLFHRSKTNNKFREYGACGIAGIYSNVDVYSSCVVNEKTGLLVSNSADSWFEAVARLIENPELREKIGKQSREYVQLHYSQKVFEELFWHQIRKIVNEKSSQKNQNEQFTESSSHSINDRMVKKLNHQNRSFHNWINKINKMKNYQLSTIFWLISRHLFDHWAVFKLRLLTSLNGLFFIPTRKKLKPKQG